MFEKKHTFAHNYKLPDCGPIHSDSEYGTHYLKKADHEEILY